MARQGSHEAVLRGVRGDQRALLKRAIKAGCLVRLGKNHIRVDTPNGGPVFMSATTSDVRAVTRQRADLRRAGVIV